MDALVTKENRVLSRELEKKLEISTQQIYETGHKVKKYKQKLNETEEKMDDMLGKGTEEERRAVEEAMARLRAKIDKIKDDDSYKALEKEAEHIEDKLNIAMEKIYPHYAKAVRKLHAAYTEKNERTHKLIEFHNVLGDAFLTKDEKKILLTIKDQIHQIPHKLITL